MVFPTTVPFSRRAKTYAIKARLVIVRAKGLDVKVSSRFHMHLTGVPAYPRSPSLSQIKVVDLHAQLGQFESRCQSLGSLHACRRRSTDAQ
jgi:hypothetical protein